LLPQISHHVSPKRGLTGLSYSWPEAKDALCHCLSDLPELSGEERSEVLEEHSIGELRAEYSTEELESLGVVP